jgi:hypothetical protein
MLNTQTVEFNNKGKQCKGEMDFFTQASIEKIREYYFSWKQLNAINLSFNIRRINLPELVSEGLLCALFGWGRTNNSTMEGLGYSSCDAVDIKTGETIQIKGCSTIAGRTPGPTSFGPESKFDRLVFAHFDCEEDMVYVYDFKDDYLQLKVNATETVLDQQKQGRRPRLTLLSIVKNQGLPPLIKFNLKTGEII